MKKCLYHYAVFAALILPGCVTVVEEGAPAVEEKVEEAAPEVNPPSIIPGEMIVEFTEEMTAVVEKGEAMEGALPVTRSGALNGILAELGAVSLERLYPDAGEWEPRHREAGLHRWYKVKFDTTLPCTKASDQMKEIPGVVYTEPMRRIKPMAVFNDPDLSYQWHYINDGSLTKYHKAGCDINVQPVWENFTAGTENVIVAVIDGGVDMSHYDLAAVTLPGGANGSRNCIDGNYNITAHSHGTHVAGTIGAINNNGRGGCGIAGGNDGKGGVRIMSCQVFANNPDDPKKDLSGGFYEAMVWGADHGAVISQNSWGNVYESEADAANGSVGGMKGAIDYFIKYAGTDKKGNQTGPMKGGVVIFAAGNEGWRHAWPAEYDAVIAVGASGPGFSRAYYSNYGDWVDIAAPGGDADVSNGQIYSTLPNNGYGWSQGTSMACPHVSGVAALLVSYFGGPGFTNEMLKNRLLGGARQNAMPPGAQIGPLMDAYGSFTFGGTTPPEKVTSFTVKPRSNFLDFSWKVTRDQDDKKAFGYILLASTVRTDLADPNPASLPSSVKMTQVMVGSEKVGATITGTLSDLEFDKTYYTCIIGYDYNKNYSAPSPIVQATTGINNPPVISTDYTGSFTVRAHEVLRVNYTISDPDGHAINIVFDGGSPAASNEQLPEKVNRLTINAPLADAGSYTAKYTVTDSYGASAELSIPYVIMENQAPVVTKQMDNLVYEHVGDFLSLNLDEYFHDPDDEPLSYKISDSNPGVVHLNPVANVINITTMSYGVTDVSIKGSDAKGLSASLDFQVLVRNPESDPDVYPTMVEDILNISDGAEKTISVTITNSNGAKLMEGNFTASAFNPVKVDMSGYAPGRYFVKVVSGGKTVKRTVIKL